MSIVSPKPVQQSQFETQRQIVEAKLQSGKELDIYDALFLSHNYPETARQYALVQRTNADLASGKPLDIYEALTVSKYAPDTARQLAKPQEQTKTVTSVNRAGQKQSQVFYTNIGYPEFGGEYAPFEIPKGMKVSSVQEKDSELTVAFESTEKPSLLSLLSLGAGEGLTKMVTVSGISPIFSAGAMSVRLPSASRYLYEQGLGMEQKEALGLNLPKYSSGMYALAGLTQAVENTFVAPSSAETILSLPEKPQAYIAGYGLGLVGIYGPLVYSGTKYLQSKVGESWEPLLWEKQVTGEKLGSVESAYMKSQYPDFEGAAKPSIEQIFKQQAPTLAELEAKASQSTGINVGGIRELPSPDVGKVMDNLGSSQTFTQQVQAAKTVQRLSPLVTTETFLQGQYLTKLIPAIPLTLWMGKAYPGTQRARVVEEIAVLHYPFESLAAQRLESNLLSVQASKLSLMSIPQTRLETKTGLTSLIMTVPKVDFETTLEPLSVQSQKQELGVMQIQLQKQIQKQQTQQRFDFDFQLEKRRPRKKVGSMWTRRYMWEFPVKGAKEMWKAL